jgi:hypothetical protein
MRAGSRRSNRDAEPLDDTLFEGGDNEYALPGNDNQEAGEEDVSESSRRQEVPELQLGLLEYVFKRIAFSAPWVFGVPNHAA